MIKLNQIAFEQFTINLKTPSFTSNSKNGPFHLKLFNGSLCAIANKDIDIACVTLVYSWSTCYSRLLPSSPPIMCCKITNLVYLLLKY